MSTVEQKAGADAVEERPATSGSNNQVCKSCTLETETAERGTKRKLGADVSGLCKKPTTGNGSILLAVRHGICSSQSKNNMYYYINVQCESSFKY